MHWELLSDDMRTVLLRLREAGLCEGFYLTGGTAWRFTSAIVARWTWTSSRGVPNARSGLQSFRTRARGCSTPPKCG